MRWYKSIMVREAVVKGFNAVDEKKYSYLKNHRDSCNN
jgi:hypothetical protein